MSSKKNQSSPLRAAAVVMKVTQNGLVLVATHVPEKSQKLDDYSQTTLTAKMPNRHSWESSIMNGVKNTLGIGSSMVQELIPFREEFTNTENAKTYFWGLVILDAAASEDPDPQEIKDFFWNPLAQVLTMLETMSQSRQEMFLYALGESVQHVPELAEFASRIVRTKENLKQAA